MFMTAWVEAGAFAERGTDEVPSGIHALGQVPWGTHICQFYRSASDLVDVLVPYFVAGLQNREKCLWVASEPLPAAAARDAIVRAWPEARRCIESAQLLVVNHDDWYSDGEATDLESVVRAWFERESAACQEGYRGLRVTGNTSWLKREGWVDFCRYEAEVQRGFDGCNILALCSYALADCSSSDVVDVVRNHQCALLHRGGGVVRTRGATATLAMLDTSLLADPATSSGVYHAVQFFDAGAYPSERIAEFLATALDAGGGCLAIATSEHLASISRALWRLGVDPGGMDARRVRLVDASEALARFMGAAGPDRGRLRDAVDDLFGSVQVPSEKLHVYGEAVDVLVRDGRADAALRLEELWQEVVEGTRCKLLCGYAMQSFVQQGKDDRIREVCASHASVHPVHPDAGARGQGSTEQRLGAERDAYGWIRQHRRDPHRAGNPDLWEAERFSAMLHTIKSALFDAVSVADVWHAIRDEISQALHADHVALALAQEGSSELRLVDRSRLEGVRSSAYQAFPLASDLPLALAFRRGRALLLESALAVSQECPVLDGVFEALAALPLATRRTRFGAIEFGFARARIFSPAQRAFLEDAAKQVSTTMERIRLREVLREGNRRKDEFLGLLGNGLRDPLAPIATALQSLRVRGIEAVERARDVIERQTEHLTHLVDDLLDISRITQGTLKLRSQRVELASVLARAIEIASPLIEEQGHRLSVDGVTTRLWIEVDPARFAQVIANLLINAAQYTERGGRIDLTCVRADGMLEIAVLDTGSGIPEDVLGSIFDPFVQLEDSRPRADARGLGLGLALVKTLTELQGGSVHASSPGCGRGSTFTVRIPALPD
jgi:signal transduction histidine kinase